MLARSRQPRAVLPRRWPQFVKSAVLHTIALAQYAAVYTRSWAGDSRNARVRLAAKVERLEGVVGQQREQIRILKVRMERISPHRRPQYPPAERMAILELKAACGWSLRQTARAFLVTADTVASWMRRLDEHGPEALVQLRQPVNTFPELARQVVRRLKSVCPSMGKLQMAQMLTRAGLHLGTTTVARIVKEQPRRTIPPLDRPPMSQGRVVTARHPNHVWHVDLTTVPTGPGFWTPWRPCALPQCWPFCHWVAVVVDHFSRRVMGVASFPKQPDSQAVQAFLNRAMAQAKATPKYLICDRGRQFDCAGFRRWCRRRRIKPRYGAVGRHGSIAVVERFILTLKGLLAQLLVVSYRRERFQRELNLIASWYNLHRPHTWLEGKTPEEVYARQYPASRRPRWEPRARWPRGSPCARSWALVRGKPGAGLTLELTFHGNRPHLPIIQLRRAA